MNTLNELCKQYGGRTITMEEFIKGHAKQLGLEGYFYQIHTAMEESDLADIPDVMIDEYNIIFELDDVWEKTNIFNELMKYSWIDKVLFEKHDQPFPPMNLHELSHDLADIAKELEDVVKDVKSRITKSQLSEIAGELKDMAKSYPGAFCRALNELLEKVISTLTDIDQSSEALSLTDIISDLTSIHKEMTALDVIDVVRNTVEYYYMRVGEMNVDSLVSKYKNWQLIQIASYLSLIANVPYEADQVKSKNANTIIQLCVRMTFDPRSILTMIQKYDVHNNQDYNIFAPDDDIYNIISSVGLPKMPLDHVYTFYTLSVVGNNFYEHGDIYRYQDEYVENLEDMEDMPNPVYFGTGDGISLYRAFDISDIDFSDFTWIQLKKLQYILVRQNAMFALGNLNEYLDITEVSDPDVIKVVPIDILTKLLEFAMLFMNFEENFDISENTITEDARSDLRTHFTTITSMAGDFCLSTMNPYEEMTVKPYLPLADFILPLTECVDIGLWYPIKWIGYSMLSSCGYYFERFYGMSIKDILTNATSLEK